MFDVFDIQVSALAFGAPLEIRQRETAFGAADERVAHVGGIEFGRVLRAHEAYKDPRTWRDPPDRGDWTVLVAAPAARAAAKDNERWARFLGAMVSMLHAHESWVVRCETDCDQHPLERHQISPEQLSALLDDRWGEHATVAIVASSCIRR